MPHISLYGPFSTQDSPRLVTTFQRVCKKYAVHRGLREDFIRYDVAGFKAFDGESGKVICLDVIPSEQLVKLTEELCNELNQFCNGQRWDREKEKVFHTTIAFKDVQAKHRQIMNYLDTVPIPKTRYPIIRVTLLHAGGRIFHEYDLIQNRLLNRNESLNRDIFRKSIYEIKRILYGQKSGAPPETRQVGFQKKMDGGKIIVPIMHIKDNPVKTTSTETYLISDLHLGHANIIKYCKRPFSNVEDMDYVLINNWNRAVSNQNDIYFLGDLRFGWHSRSAGHYLDLLNGKIHFVRGNHEEDVVGSKDYLMLETDDRKFLLIHDPKNIPPDWNGWTIHGHTHNNDLRTYPFINGENKTINVSADLINFTPIRLDKILSLNLDRIKRMETLNSKPEYY